MQLPTRPMRPSPATPIDRTTRPSTGRRRACSSDAIRNVQKYTHGRVAAERPGQRRLRAVDPVRHQRSGLRIVAAAVHGADPSELVHSVRGDVAARPRRAQLHVHKDGSITELQILQPSSDRRVHQVAASMRSSVEPDRPAAAEYPDDHARYHGHLLLQRDATRRRHSVMPTRTQQIGLFLVLTVLAVYALARALGRGRDAGCVRPPRRHRRAHGDRARARSASRSRSRFGGEIVSCDSTAVYRGFDIGTDKVPLAEQRGMPHHMVDVVEPTEEYSAARYAREAAAVIRDITARGKLPILVGGTGFYYRALTRGCSTGPAATRRCGGVSSASRRGAAPSLHRWLRARRSAVGRADSAARRQAPGPRARGLVLTGRPLTEHFAETASPLARLRDDDGRAADLRASRPRSAWRAASTRSSSRGCSTRCAALLAGCAGDGAAVHRAGLPPGARAPARRARRGRRRAS